MAVEQIDLSQYADRIIHNTKVDFSQRIITKTIRLMQYDDTLPIIAVTLMKDGYSYTLPEDATVEIRWGKKDHTYVKKEVLGCDVSRQIVYFEVNNNMSYFPGPHTPILELNVAGKKAGSSYIQIEIDRNPIQQNDRESTIEDTNLDDILNQTQQYMKAAQNSAENAATSENATKELAEEALKDITELKDDSVLTIENTRDAAVATVNETKDAAVTSVNNTKDAANETLVVTKAGALNEVESQKSSALSAVDAKKDSSINSINNEESEAIEAIRQAGAEAVANLDNVLAPKINVNVHLHSDESEISYNGDTVTKRSTYKNLFTGESSVKEETINLANETNAGMMSHSDYVAIRNIATRIANLENRTVRLLYSESTEPTQEQIQAFVDSYLTASGVTEINESHYEGIAVVVDDIYHIWHYYQNGIGWKDDGADTVSQFTNEIAGIIKGKTSDGYVYAENDGTGSVYGWNNLTTRVTNAENDIKTKFDATNFGFLILEGTLPITLTEKQMVEVQKPMCIIIHASTVFIKHHISTSNEMIFYGAYSRPGENLLASGGLKWVQNVCKIDLSTGVLTTTTEYVTNSLYLHFNCIDGTDTVPTGYSLETFTFTLKSDGSTVTKQFLVKNS